MTEQLSSSLVHRESQHRRWGGQPQHDRCPEGHLHHHGQGLHHPPHRPAPGPPHGLPQVRRERRERRIPAAGRQRVLDGGSEDASGYIFFSIKKIKIRIFCQAKTSPTESSVKSNAIDQFLGIECSSETRCNEVRSDGFYFEEVCNIKLTFLISGTRGAALQHG